jgi:hypothetical protein
MLGRVNVSDSSRRLGPAALVLGLLALTGVIAALGGWLWWTWWAPAPHGQIAQRIGSSTFDWFATPFDPGQAHVASSTFEYVVTGFGLALLVGLVAGVVGRDRAYLALGTGVVASALGAFVMRAVGMAFSPPDPQQWADKAHFGHHYLGSLTIGGWTPYLVWPVGLLLGFLVVMLMITGDRERTAPQAEAAPQFVD